MSAYDPQPGEAAAIGHNLTVPQRRSVRDGTTGKQPGQLGYWRLICALRAKGLFTTADRKDVLTPLGQEVQAWLGGGAA
ncbi:MAG: hypothetical protein ABL914_10865 [Novosphingobium sp.]|uniref:hypothetical protein n=1 Tax=Novosphingobium sp. TaxID=1874826 RepID=UPI0032BBF7BE